MKALISPEIESYAEKHSTPESKLFADLARATREKTSFPQMQVGALEGGLLRLLVRLTGARNVLEIGTFTGYSALAMAEGLPKGGRLTTLDIDPATTAIARKTWAKSPHGRKIELRLGPAAASLRTLKGPFDFVFIDADKENYSLYWNLCVPKTRKGGLIAVDNVLWSGRVLSPADSTDRAIAAFNKRAAADKRVDCVMLACCWRWTTASGTCLAGSSRSCAQTATSDLI